METDLCTLDQFKNFFYLKAFDIIGNGSFKKHLAKCKETNDNWAIVMLNDVQHIQNIIRNIYNKVHEIPSTPNNIFEICKDIMSSAQPPIKMFAGTVTCSISGVICNQCLDFSKIHKQEGNVFVDAKFSHFFLFLWYTNKIEYIIRSYVRNWVLKQTETNYKQLCEKIQVDLHKQIEEMHKLFLLAYHHVMLSLQKLIDQQLHKIIVSF